MKINISLTLSAAILAGTFGMAAANQDGTSTAQFLKIGQGARAEGMGGAYVAVADEARAVSWNPAGLAQVSRQELAFDHLEFIEEIRTESLAGVYPVNSVNGSLGVGITYVNYGSIDRLDSSGNAEAGETSVNSYSGTVSWGQAIGDRLALGAGLKILKQNLAGTSSNGFAGDIGALFYLVPDKLSLGASIMNFGPKVKVDSTDEDLPTIMRGGAALHAIPSKLLFALDIEKENDAAATLHAGTEYVYQKTFVGRVGYQNNHEAGGGLSAGVGFIWHPASEERRSYGTQIDSSSAQGLEVKFDYAYVDFGDFDATHRIGVLVGF
jgi:Uncharacterised protein family (UPF0164)